MALGLPIHQSQDGPGNQQLCDRMLFRALAMQTSPYRTTWLRLKEKPCGIHRWLKNTHTFLLHSLVSLLIVVKKLLVVIDGYEKYYWYYHC